VGPIAFYNSSYLKLTLAHEYGHSLNDIVYGKWPSEFKTIPYAHEILGVDGTNRLLK